jgi:uncharacterized membrane protein YdjX (TVP38/TMEM64 family)
MRQSTIISVTLIAMTAAVLRFGGRAAFVSLLGLDFIKNEEIASQIDQFLAYFKGFGTAEGLAVYFLAWLVVKTLCLDGLTVVLAVASGLLFGGFWEGTLASVFCATLASSVDFQISRVILGDKMKAYIQSRSSLRNIDRACAKDGFKTVLTLRLSPILPIPVAAYSYLYGATSIAYSDFAAGLALGSVKPYGKHYIYNSLYYHFH